MAELALNSFKQLDQMKLCLCRGGVDWLVKILLHVLLQEVNKKAPPDYIRHMLTTEKSKWTCL
jgi:hypothetical protein